MKYGRFICVALLTVIFSVSAVAISSAADVRVGIFDVNVDSMYQDPNWDPAANDGYENTWFEYPQPGGDPSWWNQWWYNDPLLIPGGKWVDIAFHWEPINWDEETYLEVTINWTTPQWNYDFGTGPDMGTATPPIPGMGYDPEMYIERLSDYQAMYPEQDYTWIIEGAPGEEGDFYKFVWLPIDYNPEWVSIDIRGENISILGGVIQHQCTPVPIPGGILLLGSGLAGLVCMRRRTEG